MRLKPSSPEFFEAKYLASPDPWNFASRVYENFRYSKTIDALGDRRFKRAFEPGCSIGALTQRLALHCAEVEAMDVSSIAVDRARRACSAFPHVHISQGSLADAIPQKSFDLIVFSEVGYYCEPSTLRRILKELHDRLIPGGVFLAVHWLGQSQDHRMGGDEVHQHIERLSELRRTLSFRYVLNERECFCLGRWTKL